MRKQAHRSIIRAVLGVVALSGVLATPVLAQDALSKPEDVLSQDDQLKTKNGFGAQFWVTDNERFFFNWVESNPRNLNPVFVTHRDIRLFLAVFVLDPAEKKVIKADGTLKVTSDVTYDFRLVKPDGSVSSKNDGIVGWLGTAPPRHLLQLLKGRLTMKFEIIDPPGTYSLFVRVHDNVSKTDIDLQRTLVLQD